MINTQQRYEVMNDDVHEGIKCDGCEMNPIRGLRFKCLDCPDFDLCEECYNREVHKHHKMKSITTKGMHLCHGIVFV